MTQPSREAPMTPNSPEPLTAEWPETRRLILEGRVVISQTPTDPGDIGEPRIAEVDDTTYVSVPEFELWPTDPDWEPHDASIVYVTKRSFTLNAPGRITYHRPSRHTRYSDRTGCGIEIWSSGWEPGEQSSLIAVRRDVASRVARPCAVCGDLSRVVPGGSEVTTPTLPAMRCSATRQRAIDPSLPPKQCPRRATHGEWCRQHAESIGGWRLCPPDPNDYRGLAASFWVHYRCGYVDCRIVEPHEHGGGEPTTEYPR